MNFILSFILGDKGFDEPIPIERSNKKCQADKAEMGKGIKKCKVKNLPKLALPTRNPPHNHSVALSPSMNITVRKFVITVAAQKLICPQGKTYPINAVRTVTKNNTTPLNHRESLPSGDRIEA